MPDVLKSATLLVFAAAAILSVCCAGIASASPNPPGDGKADASPAIQTGLDALAEAGGVFNLPAGRYRLDHPINIPSGVTLAGTWQAPHHAEGKKGTILLGYAGKGTETGPPLIHLSPNSAIKGVTIFYPEQKLPEPYPYPWTIQGEGMHGSVMDITLVNCYKGIDFGEKSNELHYIRNVFGCPLKAGVHIDKCTDIGRIENVHFNPHYWQRSGEPGIPAWEDLMNYIFHNLVAFSIARSDWEFMHNTFCFGAKVGYRFYNSESGACNGNFLGIASDWAETAVLVEQTQPPGLLITNGEFVGGKGSHAVIDILPSHSGVVQLSNCAFWGPVEANVRVDGPGYVSLNQCNFVNWDKDRSGVPCIQALGGELNIANCMFREDKKQIELGPNVLTATILANRFAGSQRIVNRSHGDIQIANNVVRK